jgi:hypothetical protein
MRAEVLPHVVTVLVLFCATSWDAGAGAECLRYGDVTLTGRLVQQIRPGPPEYESVTSGDQALVIWILQLDRGVCIVGADSSYPIAYSEKEIQLVLGSDPYVRTDAYRAYRDILGKTITVSGRLAPGGGKYEKRFVIAAHRLQRARV